MIKLFEEYNQYYQEIDRREYCLNRDDDERRDFFNREEYMILSKIDGIDFVDVIYVDSDIDFMQIKGGKNQFSIIKCKDEWYYTEIWLNYSRPGRSFRYYKCDQWEGLLKLIEDFYDKVI